MLSNQRRFLYKSGQKIALVLTAAGLFLSQGLSVFAENEIEERIRTHQAMEIQSNNVPNWPTGPIVSAESAILIEAETGAVLYEKNIHEKQYPASTTKILTALIAAEECSMDEIVEFSYNAVFSVPRDSNHIAMDAGQALTMEDCLNAILIRSANEVCNAVAEHISGSVADFAERMNERAAELGCTDSHFVNPNGLPDENHYTSAYDLAQIGRAFFDNEMLCRISTSTMMHILPWERQPREKLEVTSNQILENGSYAYEYIIGAKTGYTNAARSCLVTAAEKNGMKLICAVLNDESPMQYEDTIALYEYGFSNFDKVNIAKTETKYNMDNDDFFYSENDIFGSSKPLLSLNENDYIILPKTADFTDTVSTISYETGNKEQAAVISYTYQNVFLGSASLDLASDRESYSFNPISAKEEKAPEKQGTSFIFINVIKVLLIFLGITVAVLGLIFLRIFLKNYHIHHPVGKRYQWKRRRRRSPKRSPYQSPNMALQQRRKEQIKQAKRRRKPKRQHKFKGFDF